MVKPIIPGISTTGRELGFERFKDKVCELLTGLGLLEVETFNLTSEEKQNKLMNAEGKPIHLHNALNIEYDVLRYWVIPSVLEVLNNNLSREYPQNVFGIGTVFKSKDTDTGVLEQDRICVALCSDDSDFTKIKQVLDFLMRMKTWFRSTIHYPTIIMGLYRQSIITASIAD